MTNPHDDIPFPLAELVSDLNNEITKRIGENAMSLRGELISSQNVYRIKHGRRWRSMHSTDPDEPAEVRTHSAVTEVSKQRVVDHDVGQLSEFLADAASKMHGLFVQTMVQLLHESTEKSGNIVSAENRGFKESFEEMIEKISFGVDRYGVPSRPQALIPPSLAPRIEEAQNDASFRSRIATISEKKEKEAIADEARRIARYRRRR